MFVLKFHQKDARVAVFFGVIAVSAIILMIAGLLNRFSVKSYQQSEVDRIADSASLTFQNNIESYIYTLYGVRALINSQDFVSRASFNRYVDSLSLPRRLPGVSAIGYSNLVSPGARTAYEIDVRNDSSIELNGYPNFQIYPDPGQSDALPLTYLEPKTSTTLTSLGFNLLSEAERRAAFEMARDTDRAIMTSQVQAAGSNLDSFILLLPVFDRNRSVVSVSDRQTSTVGAVTMSFRRAALFNTSFQIFLDSNPDLTIRVYDSDSPDPAKKVYDSADDKQVLGLLSNQVVLTEVRTYDRAGKTWTMEFVLPQQKSALAVPYILIVLPLLVILVLSLIGLYQSLRSVRSTSI